MSGERDDDATTVPVVCPECDTRTRIPLDDLAERIEQHNDRRHEGADVAEVDPALKEHLADLVVEDLGLLDDEEA